jgi:hypothetical protein
MTPDQFAAITSTLTYQPRGVFFSELYLFACACLDANVTAIVESGVHHGVSTRVLRAVFPNRVTSFEWNATVVPPDLRTVVIVADGQRAVPEWIVQHPGDRVGVLLDGPKGPRGTVVREQCLAYPHVRVVGQHDSPMGSGETMHSHAPPHRSVAAELDRNVPADIMAWSNMANRPGLGIWMNP